MVEVAHTPRAYLRRLDARMQDRISARLDLLAENPFDPEHSKPLEGPGGFHSSPIGGWRIVYTVDIAAQVLRVRRIGPRGQVYRDL